MVGPTAAELVERRAGTEGNAAPAKHAPGAVAGQACPRRWNAYGQVARQRKKEKFTALLHHISIDLLRRGVLRTQERRRTRRGRADVAEPTRQTLIAISLTCTSGCIEERIGPYRPGESTYPSRTGGSVRSRLPPLKTRLSNGRPSRC